MAHESFEEPATAEVMNELFVNIKVDREERPDLDRIYQLAQQVLTRRTGGWPLTMFLTHDDQQPFFCGTYFPPAARHGLPAFPQLLRRVAEYYHSQQDELRAQNRQLLEVFRDLTPPPAGAAVQLTAAPLEAARAQLEASFDGEHGGFGSAPKFPHPTTIDFLLRRWHATAASETPDLKSLYMTSLTLRRMAEGGLHDHLGGGFARYSVDAEWMIPHFEKMLYDNGALLASYANAAVATGDELYAHAAADTAHFMLREMQSPEGGFYSSFDADSEGHEGKFYAWDRAEVQRVLTPEEYGVFAPRFGLDRAANFEGLWHLHVFEEVDRIAERLRMPVPRALALLESARAKLLEVRARRVHPGRDDKVLTSWNALAIRGLAAAAQALGDAALIAAATRALDFLRARLFVDGRLLATYKDGRAHLPAYLDDYVLLADAVLALQAVRFDAGELEFGRQLVEALLAHFSDTASGGFFFTASDHERLIHRSKTFSDDATPAGNGVAAQVLQRYGYLFGESRYLAAAEGTLRAGWETLQRYPAGHMSLLAALEEYLQPPEIVILRGDAPTIESWRAQLARLYAPHRLVLAVPAEASDLPATIADKAPRARAVAYVCRGSVCGPPLDSIATLLSSTTRNVS